MDTWHIASIMIPAKNNTGATNHCLDLIAGLGCSCRRGKGLAGVGVKRYGEQIVYKEHSIGAVT